MDAGNAVHDVPIVGGQGSAEVDISRAIERGDNGDNITSYVRFMERWNSDRSVSDNRINTRITCRTVDEARNF